MLKHFFSQDTPLVGLVAGLGSLLAGALLLSIGLLVADLSLGEHARWYAGCFVPPLLIMRYYAKLQLSTVVKTIIITLFVFFIAYMLFLFKTHSLNL